MCNGNGPKHRNHEWELCADAPDGDLEPSRQLLRHYDPDFFKLFTDKFYRVPMRMPDGNYTPKISFLGSDSNSSSSQWPNQQSSTKASAKGVDDAGKGSSETELDLHGGLVRISLQGVLRRTHRARLASGRVVGSRTPAIATVATTVLV